VFGTAKTVSLGEVPAMTEKLDICKHNGGRYLKHGRAFNRLFFCLQCGQPVIRNILDLIAFLRSPRVLQNGRVKKKKLLLSQKIDVIAENARLLHYGKKRARGRPQTPDISDPEKQTWWDSTEEGHGGFNRETANDYTGKISTSSTSEAKGYAYSRGLVRNVQWRGLCWDALDKMLNLLLPFDKHNIPDSVFKKLVELLKIFAKVHLILKKRELRFLLAALLVDSGESTIMDAMKKCGVGSHHTLKGWQEKIRVLQKKFEIYPRMLQLPAPSALLEPNGFKQLEIFLAEIKAVEN
jgi:hypothetical protein